MSSYKYDVNQKPGNEDEFKKWFSSKFGFDEPGYRRYYEQSVNNLKESFCKTVFWKGLDSQIKEWNTAFFMEKRVPLVSKVQAPPVVVKSLNSLLNKAYRKNILRNNNFPDEPDGGWITHLNWFDTIHDIIRTTVEVKYLDGVKYIEEKMSYLAKEVNCPFKCSYEARDEGYYAAHSSIEVVLPLLKQDWSQDEQKIEVEIQITTEFQEMIKGLLHKYYEENRNKYDLGDYKWQWDYHSEQFIPNYLGHIAHYLEGMIVEIRDKK